MAIILVWVLFAWFVKYVVERPIEEGIVARIAIGAIIASFMTAYLRHL